MEIISGTVTIKQIFEDFFERFEKLHPDLVKETVKENVEKMLSCREPRKIGFEYYQCPNHPEHVVKIPHSCKSRFCNTCGKIQTDEWCSNCHKILPNVEYRHLTLTIPKELRKIFYRHRFLLNYLFKSANEMLSSFFDEKKITVAYTMVLHTFGRKLNWNPHLHIIVSCGGLTNKLEWKKQEYIPYKMLSKRWMVKLLNCIEGKIKELIKEGKVSNFNWKEFKNLYGKNWYTHLSYEKIKMNHTIRYIGRYSRRPVISEAKILNYDKENERIKIEYRDHKEKTDIRWEMNVLDFIKLLIQHIPQRYFHQIRHYGLVANRVSSKFKVVLEKLFGKTKQLLEKLLWRERQKLYKGKDPLICPYCGSELVFMFRAIFSKKENKLIILR